MPIRSLRGDDRGQALVLFVIVLPLVFMFLLIVVDATHAFGQRRNLQTAADAAALAGAYSLSHAGTGNVSDLVNTYSLANGGPPVTSQCPSGSFFPSDHTDTCYAWPYVDPNGVSHSDQVEVRLSLNCAQTPTFFGGIADFLTQTQAFDCTPEAVHAVASISSGGGAPPAYNFIALDPSSENHTLLIQAGGNLTVNNAIYVDSTNAPNDAFDVFGGGSITAPAISVVGGWELHQSTLHLPTGTTCSLSKSSAPLTATQPAGCPKIGQPSLADPFAALAAPTPSAVGAGESSNRTYSTAPYSPAQYLNGTINASTGTLIAGGLSGSAISAGDTIEIGSEAMLVAGVASSGNLTTVNVIRGVGGTSPAAHTEPSFAITNIAESGTTVTLTTQSPHGLAANSTVGVSGLGPPYDGIHTVTAVPSSTTLSYSVASAPTAVAIVSKQLANNVATITTSSAHGLAVGETVTVAGVDSVLNGTWTVASVPSATSFTFTDTRAAFNRSITAEALANGTATLTYAAPANSLVAGDVVGVSGVDPVNGPTLFNGSPITASAASSSSFSYPDSATTTYTITSKQLAANGTATLTVSGSPPLSQQLGDPVTVNNVASFFNGTYPITAISPGAQTFSYTPVISPSTITGLSLAAGVVTVTTAAVDHLAANDTVALAVGDPRFNGTVTVASVPSSTSFTYTYSPTPTAVTQWADSNNIATLTTSGTNPIKAGDVVTLGGFDNGHSFLNLGNVTVSAATSSSFSFPFTHANQNPQGVPSGTATESTPGAIPSSGTATVVTVPPTATAAGKTATAPSYVAPGTSASGTVAATGTIAPTTVSGGTATLASLPANGTLSTSLASIIDATDTTPGGVATPHPYEVPSGTTTLQPGTYYGGICIGAASGSDCLDTGGSSNCDAAGSTTSSPTPYPHGEALSAAIGASDTSFSTTGGGSGGSISPGDMIMIDSEEIQVTAVAAGTGGTQTITAVRGVGATEAAAHAANAAVLEIVSTPSGTAYTPNEKLSAAIGTTDTTFDTSGGGGSGQIAANQVIEIGNEEMEVTNAVPDSGSRQTLTVVRDYNNTYAATHAANAAVLEVSAAALAPANVTLAPGTYIMAGGGFSVCGAASLSAPHVLIYNTDDPSFPASTYGALGQVNLDTSGSVALGPQASGPYAGMTIFQDRNLVLASGGCNSKGNNPDAWDIALQSMASTGANGELGSISGTIYAAGLTADFGDAVSGTANLAIITSCIFINNSNSTFNFNAANGQLFGFGDALIG